MKSSKIKAICYNFKKVQAGIQYFARKGAKRLNFVEHFGQNFPRWLVPSEFFQLVQDNLIENKRVFLALRDLRSSIKPPSRILILDKLFKGTETALFLGNPKNRAAFFRLFSRAAEYLLYH